jgi:hypothetical protein
MENLEERKQALIAEITAAFDGVAREDGVSLHEAGVIDDRGSAEERAEARAKDTESRWQDVPDELIARGHSVLSFLDAKGFRYYIPAYIVWYLKYEIVDVYEYPEDFQFPFGDSNTCDSVTFHLGMHSNSAWLPVDFHLDHYKALSVKESTAIAHLLLFLSEWEEKCMQDEKTEIEEDWKRWLANGEGSQEEYTAHLERAKQLFAESPLRDNAANALKRWWGQFL